MASVNPEAVTAARQAGYSDDQILSHLAETKKISADAVKEALAAGHSASSILGHVAGADADTSVLGAAQRGVADVARGVGSTYDVLAGNKQGTTGEGIASAVDSPNYESTPAHTGLGAAGRSMVEAAPGALGAMGIGAATARIPVVGKYLAVPAALASIAAQYFGGNARDVAKNQGHEEPSMGDLARAAGTTAAQTAVQAIPVSRMIPGANKIVSTGVKGITDSASKLATTVAAETAGNAGANAIGQVGNSAGTQKGTQFDPMQTLDAGITGAGLSAGGAGARGAVDAQSAIKYRGVTPENAPAAAALSERLQQASNGKPNKASLDAAERDIHSEIKQGASALPNLSTDAQNALARPSNLGASDLQTLKKELAGTAEGDAVMHLVQQAQMADLVRKSGTAKGDQLVGGLSSGLGRVFSSLRNPAALAGAGALGTIGLAPVLAHAPATAAGLLGLYGGARAIDAMTGARNPVARFQKRFEQPGAQVRLAQPNASAAPPPVTTAPPGPWGQRPPQTVPNVAGPSALPDFDPVKAAMARIQAEVSKPPAAVDPAAALKEQVKAATDLMAARAANARLQAQASRSDRSNLREQMMDATGQMAARRANAPPVEKTVDPIKQQIAEAQALMSARAANAKLGDTRPLQRDAMDIMAARRANAPPEEKTLDPIKQQIAEATMLMAARKANSQLADTRPFQRDAMDIMAARRANEPKVTKVSKANGKTQHTVEAPPMEAALKETQPQFQPKEPSQLPYYGEEHADVAEHKLANRPDYKDLSKARKEIIREGIVKGRMADEAHLRPLVDEAKSFDEKQHVLDLIEELHHTSSRQRAREARDHYAAQVSPTIGAKIKAALTDAFINKSKRKD